MTPIMFLILTVAIIVVLFAVFKRPMYEVIFVAFLLIAILSGNIGNIHQYALASANNYLLYAILGFICFSVILNETGVIGDFLDIIVAFAGRFSGGAGYVAICASAIMGSLSGSAPGNAASIGSITIPAMKKTGFSPELATAVSTASSSLGPLIPPSGAILVAYGFVNTAYPDLCTLSQFWIIMWGIGLWLLVQRVGTLFFYIKKEQIGPIPADQRPNLNEAICKGWKTLFLPVIILLPFVMDSTMSSFFVGRLGELGAKTFSGSLLVVIPSIASAYTLLISRGNMKKSGNNPFLIFSGSMKQVSPVIVMVFAGFAFGELFSDIGVGEAIGSIVASSNIPKWVIVLVLPLIWTTLGMFLEPLMILLMIGDTIIALAASVGINPALMAGVSIAIGHVMANMTPPFATTFFISLGIAEADFVKATKNIAVWCVLQYLVVVLLLMGILPVLGMVPFYG